MQLLRPHLLQFFTKREERYLFVDAKYVICLNFRDHKLQLLQHQGINLRGPPGLPTGHPEDEALHSGMSLSGN